MSKALENMSFEDLLQENKQLKAKNQYLQFQIDQMKRLIHGSKRERFIASKGENQL